MCVYSERPFDGCLLFYVITLFITGTQLMPDRVLSKSNKNVMNCIIIIYTLVKLYDVVNEFYCFVFFFGHHLF